MHEFVLGTVAEARMTIGVFGQLLLYRSFGSGAGV